jgi:hypothetical protein
MTTRLLVIALTFVPAVAFAQAGSDDFGRIVTLQGAAIARLGTTERSLTPGATVSRGEVLKTEARSQVQLLLADKTVMSIGPGAEVLLATLDRANERPKISVKLVVGRLWARIQQAMGTEAAFSVQTANAVAGVRGTSLVVESQGEDTRVIVDRGQVDVRNNDGMGDTTGGNTQALIHGTDAPQFTPIDDNGVQNWLGGFVTVRELDPHDAGLRLDTLRDIVREGGPSTAGAAPEAIPPPVPPIEIDPAQTARDATIRGRIEIAQ